MKKAKFGLLFKFGVGLSVVIIVTSALLGAFQIFHERSRVISDLKDKGYSLSKNLAYIAEIGIISDDLSILESLLNNLLEDKDIIYGQIFDVRGNLLAFKEKSDRPKGAMFNISVPVESSDSLSAAESKSSKVKVIGVVKAGISLERANRIAGNVIQFSIGTTSAVILLGILAAFLIIKYVLIEPLDQFIIGTREIARGALRHRIQIESSDEIGELASSFNEMAVQLEKDKEKLSAYAKNLEKVVLERTAELERSRKAILNMLDNLKEDHAKLQTVDRMKTEFLSMVSHELRTPLTPTKGYLSLLLSDKLGKLNEDQKGALLVLERQNNHLNSLIDGLLDISRLELGKPFPIVRAPVSVKAAIEDTADAMGLEAENKKLQLRIEFKGELPAVMGDESKLKRIVSNLLGNAIKFTPEGGKIDITAARADSTLRVEITDSGIGIAADHLEKIFEKFFQVDNSITRSAGGIGMGLAIAREFVKLHGGEIWAESAGLGKGSKFIFTLPIE